MTQQVGPWMTAGPALSGLSVLVLDGQASGASPRHGTLVELGWLVSRASDEHDAAPTTTLIALPEGERLPRAVTRITGISRDDLAAGLAEAEAFESLLAVARTLGTPTPTVIHYASFEMGFLRDLHARHHPEEAFAFEAVCTHQIARRLMPTLPRRGLRALAGYFGFPAELLRRSAGHVEATAHVWRHLVRELEGRGVTTWPRLLDWLAQTKAPTSKRVYPMARDKRLGLPDRPGIYKMLRQNGDVLYVGKATSLKKRVNSYFTKHKNVGERALEMLSQARDLAVEETATALEAALLEADAIKALEPPYNVHLKDEVRQIWFASRDLESLEKTPDDTHPIGPLPSRLAATSLRAIARAIGGDREPLVAARSLGTGLPFAPEPEVFSEGLARFTARWVPPLVPDPLRAVLGLSKHLWREVLAGRLVLDSDPDDEDRSWDPDRVARHLARGIVQGGQLLRRARWLCLLCDATIAWREPTSLDERRRLLEIASGNLRRSDYLEAGEALPGPKPRPRPAVLATFDVATYDRLRVVSTELKRVMGETGAAAVRVSSGAVLYGPRLASLLEAV